MLAARAPVLIALHTDHATAERVDDFIRPLLAESRRRRERGEPPLFNSHLFDGSALPLAENLQMAAELLRETNELDLLLELRSAPSAARRTASTTSTSRTSGCTPPRHRRARGRRDARQRRARPLPARSHLGNVHGHHAPGNVKLRPELLGELQDTVAVRAGHGRGFDFVFHGGSGSTLDQIRAAVANGVVEMNIDTDTQYAFTQALEKHFRAASSLRGRPRSGIDKNVYDPRASGRKAEQAMAARVTETAEALCSAGRTLAHG